MSQTKFLLGKKDIPTRWHNVVADMPNPPAPPSAPMALAVQLED